MFGRPAADPTGSGVDWSRLIANINLVRVQSLAGSQSISVVVALTLLPGVTVLLPM